MVKAVVGVDQVVIGEVLTLGAPGRAGAQRDGVAVAWIDGSVTLLPLLSVEVRTGILLVGPGAGARLAVPVVKAPRVVELPGGVPGQVGVAGLDLAQRQAAVECSSSLVSFVGLLSCCFGVERKRDLDRPTDGTTERTSAGLVRGHPAPGSPDIR